MDNSKLIQILLLGLLFVFLVIKPKPTVTLSAALERAHDDNLRVVLTSAGLNYRALGFYQFKVANSAGVSLFYKRADSPRGRVESIHLDVRGFGGGISATFVNHELMELVRDGAHMGDSDLPDAEIEAGRKLLELVRAAVQGHRTYGA